MALADGVSRLSCAELSLHAQTMIELLKIFRPDIDIKVEEAEGSTLVTVKGLAFG